MTTDGEPTGSRVLAALDEMEAAATHDDETVPAPPAEGEVPAAPSLPASHADMSFETKGFLFMLLLEKAGSVLPSKDIVPVLKNFQIEASANGLRVIATDLELSVIATTTMVTVRRPGTAVFPGKRLLQVLQAAEDSEMLVDVVDGTAHISIGRAQWSLQLQDGTDYPEIEDVSEWSEENPSGVQFETIERSKFLEALTSVRYAAGTDPVRPNLMVVDVAEGRMRASDGTRFQQAEVLSKEDKDQGRTFTLDARIPVGAVDDLVKLLRVSDVDTIEIGQSAFKIVFRIGVDVFLANKPMAQFPNLEGTLLGPALQNDLALGVDRVEMVDAIKRVRITADPETSAIILSLAAGQCTVRSRDKFGNEATETLSAAWEAPAKNVVVNYKFLEDMLTMADAKSCQFFLSSQDTKTRLSPLLLRDETTGMVGLIGQMRPDWVVGSAAE